MTRFGRRDALKVGLTSLLGTARGNATEVAPADRFTLAFGSCNRPQLAQPLWADIRRRAPDAFAWLGDIVYADTEDISRTRRLYADQAARPEYRALVAQTKIVGIWDDHDFGRNDGGSDYPKRAESQAALLDFLGEPEQSPRRAQAGIYTSYELGHGDRQVKLVLLDTRYHRDPPSERGDTLGKAQWKWLEAELAGSKARIHLIVSGYQVLPLDHSNEKWGNFSGARAHLLDLFKRTRVRAPVLLSGDRHFAELSCLRDGSLAHPLYELTSSGLTHAWHQANEPNRFRVGNLYPDRNYGIVSVDWTKNLLTLQACSKGGTAVVEHAVPLAKLGA